MSQRYARVLDSRGNKIPLRATSRPYYEGAGTGRRLHTWGTSTLGANAALSGNLSTLRARSRALVANDPNADGAIGKLAANIVGTGITPTWLLKDAGDKDLKEEIRLLWNDWVPEADAAGVSDFYGLQTLIARSFILSGEVFLRLRPRRPSDGLVVPLQLQILEADHLDQAYTQSAKNGNQIRMGIEFNKLGQRVAYWFFREHPGEQYLNQANSLLRVRVPASEVLHVYLVERPGQIRGKPWFSSVILTAKDLSDYDDAEGVRKKIAALFAGFLTKDPNMDDPNPPGAGMGEESEEDDDSPMITMEPGTIKELNRGEKMQFSEPADVGGSYEPYTERQDRRIATGIGLTYEQYTGNLKGVNYSSIRAGRLEFQRWVRQIVNNTLVFQFCRPVANLWLEQAVLSGGIRIEDYLQNRRKYRRVKWNGEGWEWVDPLKEVKAKQESIRSGLRSRTQVVNEGGRDSVDVDNENAADNDRADDLKLVYDSDARKTARTGVEQKSVEGVIENE